MTEEEKRRLSRLESMKKAREEREAKIKDLLPDEEDDEILGRAYDSTLFWRLMKYALPYRVKFILALILMVVTALLGVAGPWLIGQAIDLGIRATDFEQLRLWTAIFAVASLLEWVANRNRIQIMGFVGTRIVADVRSELFRHLHRLSLNFFNNYSVGRLMSRLISDVGVLQEFITWSVTGLFRAAFSLIGIVAVMLWMNWRLALITLSVLPLMFLLTNYWRVRVRLAYRASRQRLSLINGYLNESISGIRVTKSFTREDANFAHFQDLNGSFFDTSVDATRVSALFFPAVDFMGALAVALVVGVGGWFVSGDSLTAGTLIAFILYIDRFFDPIRELAQRYNTFQATMAACERVFKLLDTVPDLVDAPNAQDLPKIKGEVRFEDVAFGYKDGELILKDIDLVVQPGEIVALVGETGAGKSTIIRLLSRFFDVSSGRILIDGIDIRAVTQSSLRQQLGIVLQDTFLFSGTILENLRYGRLHATESEIRAAAEQLGADAFIEKLPNGYKTDVGENGVNLSMGQRQMISFVRALLSDPRILILDEATSSVDTATELQIQSALEKLLKGRSSFVIAHRLSTIVSADKILVLDQGEIVEMGNHEELLAKRGRYYNLYTMNWVQDKKKRQ